METRTAKHGTPTKKHVIRGKVHNWANRVFTIEKGSSSEQDVVIQFSHPVRYKVVKLSVAGLPKTDTDGKTIHWITNFGIVDSRGQYVRRVHYTLFLPDLPKGAHFVYYDHRGLHKDKKPKHKGSKPEQLGMVQVDFDRGDPGGGYKKPTQ